MTHHLASKHEEQPSKSGSLSRVVEVRQVVDFSDFFENWSSTDGDCGWRPSLTLVTPGDIFSIEFIHAGPRFSVKYFGKAG